MAEAVRLAAVRSLAESERVEADGRAEVDVVRVELGLAAFHLVRERIDAPASGHDVRAAAHQIRRQVVRQTHFVANAKRRALDR